MPWIGCNIDLRMCRLREWVVAGCRFLGLGVTSTRVQKVIKSSCKDEETQSQQATVAVRTIMSKLSAFLNYFFVKRRRISPVIALFPFITVTANHYASMSSSGAPLTYNTLLHLM